MGKEAFHIPSLDGIRAASFGIVFVSHAGLKAVPGGFGVTVFFFLSGFLITTLMRREFERTSDLSLKNFYIRRVLRILPPFYLILAAAVLLSATGVSGGPFEARAVVAQAVHYANYWIVFHGFGGFPPGTGVYWSLAVEEHFYLLFPLLYLGLRRAGASRKTQGTMLVGLCALLLVWRLLLVYAFHAPSDRLFVSSDTRFDSILFGCALAVGENPVLDDTVIGERVWKYVLFPLGVVGLFAAFVIRSPGFRDTLRYTVQGLALVPIFVCAMRYPTWLIMRPLNLRPVAYVGVLSYTLYLAHQIALASVDHNLSEHSQWLRGAIALGASLLIAFLLHEFVEKPCARLKRRLHA